MIETRFSIKSCANRKWSFYSFLSLRPSPSHPSCSPKMGIAFRETRIMWCHPHPSVKERGSPSTLVIIRFWYMPLTESKDVPFSDHSNAPHSQRHPSTQHMYFWLISILTWAKLFIYNFVSSTLFIYSVPFSGMVHLKKKQKKNILPLQLQHFPDVCVVHSSPESLHKVRGVFINPSTSDPLCLYWFLCSALIPGATDVSHAAQPESRGHGEQYA